MPHPGWNLNYSQAAANSQLKWRWPHWCKDAKRMDYISLNRAGITRLRQIVNENHLHLVLWVCKLTTRP